MDFAAEFDRIMDEVLSRGGTWADMAQDAAERIKREAAEVEFFAEYGGEVLRYLFRHVVHEARSDAAAPIHLRGAPGHPKVTAAGLNTPMAIFQIPFTLAEGRVRRLGDLDREDCRWLAQYYRKGAQAMATRGSFFAALAATLARRRAPSVYAAFRDRAVTLRKRYRRACGDET